MSTLLIDSAEADGPADGFGPLTFLRRSGPYAVFAEEGTRLEAWKFDPLGAGETPRAPSKDGGPALAEAEEAFMRLGERLRSLKLGAAPTIRAVRRRDDGCYWLQEPQGVTLQTWLDGHPGPVPAGVLSAFIHRLGAALEELRAHGVVHGAISPRSICLDGGEVAFSGFGVDSRAFFRILGGQAGLVEAGYAPPEAHDGARRQPLGPAADLYAAAAVVLRLATGREPIAATDLARLTGASVWPDGADPAPGLRAGVEAAMAMAAVDRPSGAAELLAAFQLASDDNPEWFAGTSALGEFAIPNLPGDVLTQFGPMRAPDEEAPAAPRRRSGRAVGAGVALAGIAAAALAGAVVWRAQPEPPPQAVAAAPAAAPAPKAPVGCAWIASGPSAWRLGCGDGGGGGAVVLPDGFGVRTVAQAEQGDVRAMERLGAFYRLRARALGAKEGAAPLYQAHDWLGRAADAGAPVRGEDARAKDDAALALGAMLARGEGERVPDLAAAERRLRQAAAGNRADTVLALAVFLREFAADDPARMAEARQLFWRVAQLKDNSPGQQQAAQAVAAIDAAARAGQPTPPPEPPAEAPPAKADSRPGPPPETKPVPKPVKAAVKAKPEPAKPKAPPAVASKSASVTKAPDPKHEPIRPAVKAAKPTPAPQPRTAPPPSRSAMGLVPRAAPFTYGPSRRWTASAFIQVEPGSDFRDEVQRTGAELCRAQGGQLESASQGEIVCPNGVNYCQVRAVAACEGQ